MFNQSSKIAISLAKFVVDHADFSVEPLIGVSKGGEHPLCDILIIAGVNIPVAKWLRLLKKFRGKADSI